MRPTVRTIHGAAVALTLLAGAVTAPALAGSAQQRTATMSYDGPSGVSASSSSTVLGTHRTVSHKDENAFSVQVADTDGGAVALRLRYVPAGHRYSTATVICGRTGRPSKVFAIVPGTGVQAQPLAGQCPDGSTSLPTAGTITVTFLRPPPAPPKPRVVPPDKRWAVVVGVTQYQSPTHPTYGGAHDAQVVHDVLIRSGWRDDHILMLVDGAASGAAMRRAMQWLVDRSAGDTFTLFHYSGHVKQRGGHEYLWPADNDLIADSEETSILQHLHGRSWLDFAGCEAQGFDDGVHTANRLVSASSHVDEKSYEDQQWHESVWVGFTWDRGVLGGAADANRDGHITVGEMLAYGGRQAPAYTANQSPHGPQHPIWVGGNPGTWRLDAPPA